MFNNFKSALGTMMIISAAITGLAFTGVRVASAASNEQTSTAKASLTLPEDATIGLKSAPDLDFGTETVSAQQTEMKVASAPQALSVSNPGINSTWSVNVTASEFTKTGATRTIQGAQIVMGNGTVSATSENNVSAKPTASENVTIDAGGADVNILSSAKDGSSIGEFDDSFSVDQVKLIVPAGNVEGSYAANLTWTLSDTPVA